MVAKILLNKQQCQILEEYDVEFLRKLDRELSFWVQGAEHSPAYRGFVNDRGKAITWDGFRRLLTKDLKFAPGLLHRVKTLFETANKPFEIVDVRSAIDLAEPKSILHKLKALGKVPFPYQIEAVQAAQKNDRGIIRLPTGAGKSIVAALLTAELGKPTIIYVVGKDLLYQMHNLFSSLFDEPIGIVGDGKCEIADLNIATIWTVGQALGLKKNGKADEEDDEKKIAPEKYKEIRDMLSKTKIHLFDECHLCACETIQEIFKRINPENLYGMSASPWRDDGADLLIESYLGNKIIDISAKKLIDEGYLVRPLIKFLPVPKYPYKTGKYKAIYSKYIINNDVRNDMIAKGAQRLSEQGFQTLVLFHNISHGKILKEKISEKISCAILSGKDDTKKRDKIKNDLENKKINCIIASKIFDIGIDLPCLSGLIVAGGGKSSVRALQRIGRVIRRAENKTSAAIIDFADQAPYLLEHSKIRYKIYSTEFDTKWPEINQ